MRNKLFAIIAIYIFSQYAFADKIKAETMIDLRKVIQVFDLNHVGETTFSVLFWDIYKSKLYTTSGTYPLLLPNGKILYEINYLADISSEELIQRTVEQWQYLGVKPENYERYTTKLQSIWPDIKDGDTLSLLIHKDRSVFYFNQAYIGIIEGVEFGEVFLDIWLSEKTSQPQLRRELLGITLNE